MSSARSIRYVRHSLQEKMTSRAFFQSVFQQQSDRLSIAVNELQSSAVGNFRLSTMDYCTMELAPTQAKLTLLLRSQIKGRGFIFYKTSRENCYSRSLRSMNTMFGII